MVHNKVEEGHLFPYEQGVGVFKDYTLAYPTPWSSRAWSYMSVFLGAIMHTVVAAVVRTAAWAKGIFVQTHSRVSDHVPMIRHSLLAQLAVLNASIGC